MIKTNHLRQKWAKRDHPNHSLPQYVLILEQFWEMEVHESITDAVWHSDTLSYGIWKELEIVNE
jgi:hypothetical protein